jgi:hypothetical protein
MSRLGHQNSCPVGTGNSSPRGKAARGVKLTTHLHLLLRLRMHRSVPLLSIHLHDVVFN